MNCPRLLSDTPLDEQVSISYTVRMPNSTPLTFTRTVCVKLDVGGHDIALAATQRAFNAATTWVAHVCWDAGITNPTTAHHQVYGETRARFGLGAQLAICARAKAVEAIRSVKARRCEQEALCPRFGPRG